MASGGYRVFAIDLLGFGGSDKPEIDYPVEIREALLADFCAELVQEPAVFVGASINALLNLMMLANHPDLAQGGILINAVGGLSHRPDELTLPLCVVMGTFVKLVGPNHVGPFLFNLVPRSRALARH